MCGIFGAIGNYSLEKVKLLAVLNESRGEDSWGLYNGVKIHKDVGPIRESLRVPGVWGAGAPYLLGHTRFRTVGLVSKENAHPYRIGRLIGAHNGVIYNFRRAEEILGLGGKYTVDSQLLVHILNENKYNLSVLSFYAGLWYVDVKQPGKVFFLRHENDLYYSAGEGAFYFSSDKKDLKAVGVPGQIRSFPEQLTCLDTKTLELERLPTPKLSGHRGWHESLAGTADDPWKEWLEDDDLSARGYEDAEEYDILEDDSDPDNVVVLKDGKRTLWKEVQREFNERGNYANRKQRY